MLTSKRRTPISVFVLLASLIIVSIVTNCIDTLYFRWGLAMTVESLDRIKLLAIASSIGSFFTTLACMIRYNYGQIIYACGWLVLVLITGGLLFLSLIFV